MTWFFLVQGATLVALMALWQLTDLWWAWRARGVERAHERYLRDECIREVTETILATAGPDPHQTG